MKKIITIFISLVALNFHAQSPPIKHLMRGNGFGFRIHYGMFNASYATLEVNETSFNNQPVYHVVGKGKSTGLLHLFFKVDDNYESYIHKYDGSPLRFIRKIDEGGYTRDIQIDFDHDDNTAYVHKKHNEKATLIQANVQDMLSSFYHLRNNLDVDNIGRVR